MENDFKINLFFNNDGENLEKLLSSFLINVLDNKTPNT